jgi:hypothetical protein
MFKHQSPRAVVEQLAIKSWYNHSLKGLELLVYFHFFVEHLGHDRFLLDHLGHQLGLFLHLDNGMVGKKPFDKRGSHLGLGKGGEEFDVTGNQ